MIRLLLLLPLLLLAEVKGFYLSWYDDPATTMTIQWIAPSPEDSLFLLQNDSWEKVPSTHTDLDAYLVYAAHLKDLTPDTEYTFRLGALEHSFKTAPSNLNAGIRFIIGGDAYGKKKLFQRMNQSIVEKDPLFVVIGGDIAYALMPTPISLRNREQNRWISFLSDWASQMVTPNGRVVPFLLGSGNHDLASDDYEIFFKLFAFPEKQLYRAIDFGTYLSLILLDTAHFQPIEGVQTHWLKNALAKRTHIPHKFAIYHVSAYPSYYPYQNVTSKKVRTYWCPLFDAYGLSLAFENHNHAYKRTYPIRNNQVDPNGIIYLGDGCWGVTPRKTNAAWYLEKRESKNHVYLIEMSEEKTHIEAIDLFGHPFDELTLP